MPGDLIYTKSSPFMPPALICPNTSHIASFIAILWTQEVIVCSPIFVVLFRIYSYYLYLMIIPYFMVLVLITMGTSIKSYYRDSYLIEC